METLLQGESQLNINQILEYMRNVSVKPDSININSYL